MADVDVPRFDPEPTAPKRRASPGAADCHMHIFGPAERLIWGSDWPHPSPPGPMPNDGALLDALWDWCRDEALYRQVLVDNPARLYGFA